MIKTYKIMHYRDFSDELMKAKKVARIVQRPIALEDGRTASVT